MSYRFATQLSPNGRRPVPPRRYRPQLDVLEDRHLPSTFMVNTVLDVVNPADRKLSLREAITKANHHAGADTIVLPAGVFKLTLAGDDNTNDAGDFDVRDTVTFQGAGAGASIVVFAEARSGIFPFEIPSRPA